MRLQLLSTLGSAFSILTGSIVASAPANSSSAVQPQLEYLFQATINITQGVSFGSGPGPLGTRASFPIVGGSFAGPEISGTWTSQSSTYQLRRTTINPNNLINP